MTRFLLLAVLLIGLCAVGWVGAGYVGVSPLALSMTLLIAAFYGVGGLELHRFQQATAGLARSLVALPEPLPRLSDWLDQLPTSLQNPVRLRVEGERIGLPGPAMTPYLVGLLVLLGMLGTFLGMVVTLNGTVIALESTTDLQAIRASLAAPVKGLGLAFGTSVAGVCASAMLGLASALCRRERLLVSQALDTRIATVLRGFSLTHQRQETLHTLQRQAQAMPELVGQLQAMMVQMDRQAQALAERLLAGQDSFHRSAEAVYTQLAASVECSLQRSLSDSARITAATIQPLVEATMAGMAGETRTLHARMADTVQRQLDGLSERFGSTVDTVSQTWQQALAQHERSSASQTAAMQAALAAGDAQRLAAWTASLASMAATLQQEWQQAGAHALAQQQQICQTLDQTARGIAAQAEAHARNTITEIAQLMQSAAEAPRVAAEVIGQLRLQLSDSLSRDNALLDRVGNRFSGAVEAAATELSTIAGQITGSAVEVSSLSEAFGFAVQLFADANKDLVGQLRSIEAALGKSTTRSDEQLAYYVAQAREVIDLSIGAQKQIVDELQQLAGRQAMAAGEVA